MLLKVNRLNLEENVDVVFFIKRCLDNNVNDIEIFLDISYLII